MLSPLHFALMNLPLLTFTEKSVIAPSPPASDGMSTDRRLPNSLTPGEFNSVPVSTVVSGPATVWSATPWSRSVGLLPPGLPVAGPLYAETWALMTPGAPPRPAPQAEPGPAALAQIVA